MPRARKFHETQRKATPKVAAQACAHPDCAEEGEYRAPKSVKHADQESPKDRFQYFCLEHIREHNSKWDFFAHMTPKEVEEFQREAITGHRKTKPIGIKASIRYRNFTDAIDPRDAWLFGFDTDARRPEPPKPTIPKKERWAMSVFDMDYPFTQADVKTKYRQLAQRYHPDKHNGDRASEEKFKEVTEAYGVLKNFVQQLAFV